MSTGRQITGRCTGIHQGENGFTMVEFMIGLMVVAVLGGLGAASLQGLMAGFRAGNTTRQVATTLHEARLKAISQSTSYKVTFHPAGSYQIDCNAKNTLNPASFQRYRNKAGAWVCDGHAVRLPATVRLRDGNPTTFANDEVVFTPTGALAPIPSGSVYLADTTERQRYRITVVGLTGRVKVWPGWE